jgi:carbon-monoxide dehydrogenase small subunit
LQIDIKINGTSYQRDIEARTLLVDFIREEAGLTGTNVGCDTSQCGACTVHMNGAAVKSCTVLAVQADGSSVTTIEGLARNGELHPMQAAFTEKHGLQCGFCTPGMIMTAAKLVESHPDIEEDDIRHGLEGNLCRCTGYENIVRAVTEASRRYDPHSPWETEQAEHKITLREAERRARERSRA